MRRITLALMLVVAGCGASEGPTVAPTAVPTASTTAEEAHALDGPVMRYPQASSPSGNLDTLLSGVLQLEGDCLYLAQDSLGERYPVLWPADTHWDVQAQSVVSPTGALMPIGSLVQGRGGYFYLSDVHLLAGTAASNLAARCVDNTYQQVAGVQNAQTAIGPSA